MRWVGTGGSNGRWEALARWGESERPGVGAGTLPLLAAPTPTTRLHSFSLFGGGGGASAAAADQLSFPIFKEKEQAKASGRPDVGGSARAGKIIDMISFFFWNIFCCCCFYWLLERERERVRRLNNN